MTHDALVQMVDDHVTHLESALVTLNRIDSFQLDGVDNRRLSDAKRVLKREIELLSALVSVKKEAIA